MWKKWTGRSHVVSERGINPQKRKGGRLQPDDKTVGGGGVKKKKKRMRGKFPPRRVETGLRKLIKNFGKK